MSWLIPSRLSLSLLSGARGAIGRRKARVFLPFPFPSPKPTPRRRRRLGTSPLAHSFFFLSFFFQFWLKSCFGRNIEGKEYIQLESSLQWTVYFSKSCNYRAYLDCCMNMFWGDGMPTSKSCSRVLINLIEGLIKLKITHTWGGADDVAADAEEDEEPLELCKPKTWAKCTVV